MSESKARSARVALAGVPDPAPAEPDPDGPDEPAAPRLLIVQLADDGNFQVHHQGVSELEAPMLLRLAAKAVEDKHGL